MADEHHIPLVEERARVSKRRRATGRVTIKLQTTEESGVLEEAITRESAEIVRTPMDRIVKRAPSIRVEDGVVIVPVIEEELVVRKRLRLKEELRVKLISEVEPVQIPVVLRRNQATVSRSALGVNGEPLSGLGATAMNRTVTAFYPSRQEAEQVRSQLTQLGVPERHIEVVTSESHRQQEDDQGGFFGFLGRLFIPKEDHSVYNEGLSRGHAMLTAHLDEDQADEAISVLEQSDAMDLDLHEAEWRIATSQKGIDAGYGSADPKDSIAFEQNLSAGHGGAAAVADSEAGDRSGRLAGEGNMLDAAGHQNGTTRVTDMGIPATTSLTPGLSANGEQAIPVVSERLVVGKREVGRGGVRVRSYVVETPVEEQIALRSERIAVERRTVDQPVTNAEALLQDGEIVLEETEEVPVVAKEAVVTEEIILRKDATERVETVHDTVRRTEVDVQDTRPAT